VENIALYILLKKSKEFINSFTDSDVLKKKKENLHLKLRKFTIEFPDLFKIFQKYIISCDLSLLKES